MRLGAYPCKIKKNTLLSKLYGAEIVSEMLPPYPAHQTMQFFEPVVRRLPLRKPLPPRHGFVAGKPDADIPPTQQIRSKRGVDPQKLVRPNKKKPPYRLS